MIDISDGLVGDLRHVADASGVDVDLRTDALAPIARHWSVRPRPSASTRGTGCWAGARTTPWSRRSPVRFPGVAGDRRVLDGPAAVLVDGAPWRGYAGWQSFCAAGRRGPLRSDGQACDRAVG